MPGNVAFPPVASSLRDRHEAYHGDGDGDGGGGDDTGGVGREIKKPAPRGVHVRSKSVSGTFPLQLATW